MNDIIQNFKDIVTKKYTQFKGRADRGEFWKFVLVYVVIMGIFSILMQACSSINVLRIIIMILYIATALALLLPYLAVSVRRLHDVGKGGGWLFINFVPVIGSIWYLILTVKPSEPNENRFN